MLSKTQKFKIILFWEKKYETENATVNDMPFQIVTLSFLLLFFQSLAVKLDYQSIDYHFS